MHKIQCLSAIFGILPLQTSTNIPSSILCLKMFQQPLSHGHITALQKGSFIHSFYPKSNFHFLKGNLICTTVRKVGVSSSEHSPNFVLPLLPSLYNFKLCPPFSSLIVQVLPAQSTGVHVHMPWLQLRSSPRPAQPQSCPGTTRAQPCLSPHHVHRLVTNRQKGHTPRQSRGLSICRN